MKRLVLAAALVGMLVGCGDGGLGVPGDDAGLDTVADARGCKSLIEMTTDGICTAYSPAAGLPCGGMDWYVGGELQPTGSYEVICSAGAWVSRNDDTCAAIAKGTSVVMCVR
jgi:hypothetical protein